MVDREEREKCALARPVLELGLRTVSHSFARFDPALQWNTFQDNFMENATTPLSGGFSFLSSFSLDPQDIDLNKVGFLGNVDEEYPLAVQHGLYFGAYWLHYYTLIHVLYYVGALAFKILFSMYNASAETLKISKELTAEQIRLSEIAFPLYSAVPALSNLCVRLGISKLKGSVEATGGLAVSVFNFLVYLFLVEGMIYYVHYWLLHKWKWGKEHLKHDVHHSYKHESEMFTWSGYAFEAIDGSLQGLPLVIGTLLVPIPSSFHIFSGAFVGVWTMYIHTGTVVSLPWPFMGSDYHLIHHGLNWYNFGLYTMFWDSLFGTLKHPSKKVDKLMKQAQEGGKSLEELHAMYHTDDIFKAKRK